MWPRGQGHSELGRAGGQGTVLQGGRGTQAPLTFKLSLSRAGLVSLP